MSAGVLSQVSIGQESTWGTAVVPSKTLAVKPNDGIQTDTDVQMVTAVKGQLAKNISSFKGAVKHEGSYELDFIPSYVGYLLKSGFGGLSSALKGGESVVYEHTFSEAESKPSLTVEQAVGEIVRRFAGTIVHTLNFSCEVGGTLMLSAGVNAKTSASATKITPVTETIRPFNFADIGASGFKIGGTSFDEVESFSLEYKNNVEPHHVLGNNDPFVNFAKASEVTGNFEMYLNSDSAARYTDYLNKTDQALEITFTGDSIGTSSNYKIYIHVPKVSFTAATFPITEDYNLVRVDFEAFYDTTTSKLISAILTNLTSAYS